jgi:hypothetical protein
MVKLGQGWMTRHIGGARLGAVIDGADSGRRIQALS